ncbi:MAG: Hsp70 family protein [Polyangiaceae bacterium]|nr:Hsp70 family protein [Polyangiaceae bacterium]MCW5792124.1 Hsp70 family protein [Polyangiaceae bacterium]
MSRFVVGIDLGTTHSALATVDTQREGARSEVLGVTQLTSRGEHEARPLLPSFVYFAHQGEGALSLPWDAERRFAVGELARRRSAEAPGRVISSAKSWLSHTGIDRRAEVLPLGAQDDVEKISPVEASFRYLDHLAESWQASDRSHPPLAEQEVVLAVPASFDAAARDLTVEAAYAAGFEQVSLLEEPQAALYAWLEAMGDAWRQELSVGDLILVVDIGGGTTDFSAIACKEQDGALSLERVAVGDHILLGGDNMDLALAHTLAARLAAPADTEQAPQPLDRWQLAALTHACRAAKERLFSEPDLTEVPVVVPTRGSQLLGGSLRASLRREDVEQVILEGFFPEVTRDARPKQRARAGLTQVGLPYASDPAVTRHLAAFLTRQAGALGGSGAGSGGAGSAGAGGLLRPTRVLFNGGVLKAPSIKSRILTILNGWLEAEGAPSAVELPYGDLDLAVARGAAYFGAVRRSGALKIRGGTARAYYVGIEAPTPAVPGLEPPVSALCVAPFGMEEGTQAELPPQELALIVGEPVRFRFFGSSVRRQDVAGTELLTWSPDELTELAPIEATLPAEGRAEGDLVPIRLGASVTAIGTLLLEAEPMEPLSPNERWKLELNVRE